MKMALTSEGMANVRGLTDPRPILDVCHAWNPDLLLLDLNMPHMSGLQVLEALKKVMADTGLPVIVVSGQGDHLTHRRVLGAGARDFVIKPFLPWALAHRVRNLLEIRWCHRRLSEISAAVAVKRQQATLSDRATPSTVVIALHRAIAFRDNGTGVLATGIGGNCRRLALAAGLPPAWADLLMQAAPLHDLGMIAVPDDILFKKAAVTASERALLERHVIAGAEILGDDPDPVLELARIIARTHHEHWDGSGYPMGLEGEAIPIGARIVTICVAFDALTAARADGGVATRDAALAIIRDDAGREFDPALVACFLTMIAEAPAASQAAEAGLIALDCHSDHRDAIAPVSFAGTFAGDGSPGQPPVARL